MKIGIESNGFYEWAGGIDFVRHVASCIELADSENQYEKHILLAKNDCVFYLKKTILPFRSLVGQLIRGKPLHWQTWKGFDEHYLRKFFLDFQCYQLDFPGSRFSDHLAFAKQKISMCSFLVFHHLQSLTLCLGWAIFTIFSINICLNFLLKEKWQNVTMHLSIC